MCQDAALGDVIKWRWEGSGKDYANRLGFGSILLTKVPDFGSYR